MQKESFFRRVASPILVVLGVMLLSTNAYDLSREIRNPTLHQSVSHASAALMFLSIWLGALSGVRTARHKYVEYQDAVRPAELFDVEDDPREKRNLLGTEGSERSTQEPKGELERLKKETDYRFITGGCIP